MTRTPSKSAFLLCLLALTFSACERKETPPSILRIGLLPDQAKEVLVKRYTPLLQHLSQELNLPYELAVPESYEALLELFHTKNIDLAYFGGYTFAQAHIIDRAIPVVMRNTDLRFTSLFLVQNDNHAQHMSDLRGKRFGFGSEHSTSGHHMPRFFLQEEYQIIPESYFESVQYSGRHDTTMYWLRDGVVDVGVANRRIVLAMFDDGRLNSEDFRILWESPPYSDYVWAIQRSIPAETKDAIRQAFLKLSVDNERHVKILEAVSAEIFVPASTDDFSQILTMVDEMSQSK